MHNTESTKCRIFPLKISLWNKNLTSMRKKKKKIKNNNDVQRLAGRLSGLAFTRCLLVPCLARDGLPVISSYADSFGEARGSSSVLRTTITHHLKAVICAVAYGMLILLASVLETDIFLTSFPDCAGKSRCLCLYWPKSSCKETQFH